MTDVKRRSITDTGPKQRCPALHYAIVSIITSCVEDLTVTVDTEPILYGMDFL
jgi:hypothetical protein